MTSIERRHRQAGQGIGDEFAQAGLADILIEHPQEMADPGPAAVFETFLCQLFVDRLCELLVADERRMRIEQIERAGVADRHERQLLALGEREDADIERVEARRVDGAQFACARAGCRFQLQ